MTGILAATLETSRQPSRGLVVATGGWTETVSCSLLLASTLVTTAQRTRFLAPEAQDKHVHIGIIAVCLSGDRTGVTSLSGNLVVRVCTSNKVRAVQGSNVSDTTIGTAFNDGYLSSLHPRSHSGTVAVVPTVCHVQAALKFQLSHASTAADTDAEVWPTFRARSKSTVPFEITSTMPSNLYYRKYPMVSIIFVTEAST